MADYSYGASFYVATNGDNMATGSSVTPWKTIGFGIEQLSPGDTLIVKAGTYTGKANFINSHLYPDLPSGIDINNRTTIKAETPLSVRIEHNGSLNFNEELVKIKSGYNYIHVEGFIFNLENAPSDPSYIVAIGGDYNIISKSIMRRAGRADKYGGWIALQGDYNLAEDCAGVGNARYGFYTGGTGSSAQYNIFRRCVGRVDYSNSDQPQATFSVYGNNNNANVHDHLFQNCIALDGHAGPSGGLGEDMNTWGAWYFPKNATNVTVQGSISLNSEVHFGAFVVKEEQGSNVKLENTVAWGTYGPAPFIRGVKAGGNQPSLKMHNVTIGNTPAAAYETGSSNHIELKNSLLIGNASIGKINGTMVSHTNNAVSPANFAEGNNQVSLDTLPENFLDPSTSADLTGTGENGVNVGATILKSYGVTGTVWGQAGYDQLTNENLWPWKYEDEIKAVFSESNPSPIGVTPSSNNTIRGFTTDEDDFGTPMTLTKYIWQAMGTKIPEGIYDPDIIPPVMSSCDDWYVIPTVNKSISIVCL